MEWSETLFAPVFARLCGAPTLSLREHDYVVDGAMKVGGNAQAVIKDRFVGTAASRVASLSLSPQSVRKRADAARERRERRERLCGPRDNHPPPSARRAWHPSRRRECRAFYSARPPRCWRRARDDDYECLAQRDLFLFSDRPRPSNLGPPHFLPVGLRPRAHGELSSPPRARAPRLKSRQSEKKKQPPPLFLPFSVDAPAVCENAPPFDDDDADDARRKRPDYRETLAAPHCRLSVFACASRRATFCVERDFRHHKDPPHLP